MLFPEEAILLIRSAGVCSEGSIQQCYLNTIERWYKNYIPSKETKVSTSIVNFSKQFKMNQWSKKKTYKRILKKYKWEKEYELKQEILPTVISNSEIHDEVNRLTFEDKLILNLYYHDNLTLSEISQQLNCGTTLVFNKIQNILHRLRDRLKD